MAFTVTSSSSTLSHFSLSLSSSELKAPQIGSFRMVEQPAAGAMSLSQRQSAVKPVNAEPKRNDSVVPLAATISAPEVVEKTEVEDYEQLGKDLGQAFPLEIIKEN